MDWHDRLPTMGGGLGGVTAFILNINIGHVVELGLYALVGSVIGEAVKETISFVKKIKKRKSNVK